MHGKLQNTVRIYFALLNTVTKKQTDENSVTKNKKTTQVQIDCTSTCFYSKHNVVLLFYSFFYFSKGPPFFKFWEVGDLLELCSKQCSFGPLLNLSKQF